MGATRILLAVLVLFGIISIADGLRSGLGSSSMPGSGGWILVIGSILTLASLCLLLEKGTNDRNRHGVDGLFYVPGAVLFFALTYGVGGLLVAAVASAALASRAFPGRGQAWIVPAAGLAALSLWLALSYELQMPVRLFPIGLGV